MSVEQQALEELADRLRAALDSADVDAVGELLQRLLFWGPPDDPTPPCRNRDQVLAWYGRGRAEGVRARVTEVVVGSDKILIGLKVVPRRSARGGGESDRWQVWTVSGGLAVDIRGFDDRAEAAARAGVPSIA